MFDRFRDWRNTTLQSTQFHRFARRNVFTSWMARRRARQLFDVCAGFVYSQVLDACVSLDVFTPLANGPKSNAFLTEHTGLSAQKLQVLLRSAVSLKLLESRANDHTALGIHGAALLANPGVINMIKHHRLFYADVQNPVQLLSDAPLETKLSKLWDYSAESSEQDESVLEQRTHYTELMSTTQAVVAEQIIDCVKLHSSNHLMDVGGNDGTFLRTAGRNYPELQLTLFDLPSVAKQAQTKFSDETFAQRVQCVGGDMHNDVLPVEADIISLIRVLHDHDDEPAQALLKRCFDALPAGGKLLLAEPMGVQSVGDPTTDAYFGFYFSAMGQGRCRTAEEIRAFLKTAGFQQVDEVKTAMPFLARVLIAKV